MKKGFSVMELIIVVIIVAILSAFGLVQYYKTTGKVYAKEAEGQLKTILQAEAVNKFENVGALVACNATQNCNGVLGIPLDMQKNRMYCTDISNPNSICASARTPDNTHYSMNSSVGVVYTGDCPVVCM